LRSEFAQEEARVTLVSRHEEDRERELERDTLKMGNFRKGARQAKISSRNGKVGLENEG